MNGKELLKALARKEFNKNMLFSELRGENIQKIKNAYSFAEAFKEAKTQADKNLGKAISEIPYSKYRLYEIAGDRAEYNECIFERRKRLNALAFMSIFEGSPEYISELEDIIWATCNEYTWAQPAHIKNSLLIEENPICPHLEVIDLTNAEMAFALAEIITILEEKLEPAVIARAKAEVFKRVINPFINSRFLYNWETSDTNWASVCGGSVGAAAIYLIDDVELLTKILIRILDTMECYMGGFGKDGACREGMAYWSYGISYYMAFSEILKQRTMGKIDLLKQERFKEIALYFERIRLHGNTVANFSDCSPTFVYRSGYIHKLNTLFPEVNIPSEKYKMHFHDGLYRWAPYIRDIAWRREIKSEEKNNPLHHCFENAQIFVSRWQAKEKFVCFATIGADNGASHNHNDIGHFIYQKNGKYLFCDIGAGAYVKGYFDEERYTFFTNCSRGHSVPIIGGKYQSAGENYYATDFSTGIQENIHYVSMDIASAYDRCGADKVVREFKFYPDGKLEISDNYKWSANEVDVTERFIVCADSMPNLINDGTIEIRNGDEAAFLRFDNKTLDFIGVFETEYSIMTKEQKVYYLDFALKSVETFVKFEIE